MKFRADQTIQEGSKSESSPARRRARLVLWAAGVATIVGLAAGGIASAHLTSSLSDYDAPGPRWCWRSTRFSVPPGPTPKRAMKSSFALRLRLRPTRLFRRESEPWSIYFGRVPR